MRYVRIYVIGVCMMYDVPTYIPTRYLPSVRLIYVATGWSVMMCQTCQKDKCHV